MHYQTMIPSAPVKAIKAKSVSEGVDVQAESSLGTHIILLVFSRTFLGLRPSKAQCSLLCYRD